MQRFATTLTPDAAIHIGLFVVILVFFTVVACIHAIVAKRQIQGRHPSYFRRECLVHAFGSCMNIGLCWALTCNCVYDHIGLLV